MKKSSTNIDVSSMVKRPDSTERFKLKPLALSTAAAALVLTGCSQPTSVEPQDLTVFKTLNDCIDSGKHTVEQCETAYSEAERNAMESGPRYNSRSQCETDFGYNACTSRSGGIFGPLLAGYVIGQFTGDVFDRRYRSYPIYDYRNQRSSDRDSYVFGDGTVLGSNTSRYHRSNPVTVNTKSTSKGRLTTSPKVTTTKTVSKGGFGSTSSSKSSWSSSSSKSSWGG